jgi:hypothetical protein
MNSEVIEKFKARVSFIIDFLKFYFFLKKMDFNKEKTVAASADSYVIVICPWVLNTTPWFSVVVGLLLNRRVNNVSYLVDDLKFGNSIDHNIQLFLIKIIAKVLKRANFEITYLSSFHNDEGLNAIDISIINRQAFSNAVHKNRGEEESETFNKLCRDNKDMLTENIPAIKNYIKQHVNSTLVLPGGVYGNSGIFVQLLLLNEVKFSTFDSGFSILLSCIQGVAAQLADIPRALNLILEEGDEHIERAITFALDEFEKRKNGTDKLNSQYRSIKDSVKINNVGFLIPLNSPWDSAALDIDSVFSSYNEWLIETVGMILQQSELNVTIRQHPNERLWWGYTKTDFKALLDKKFNSKRIQFISCFDEVNSYALLEDAHAVICYSSTFGIESVIAGKPLCVCSNVYYSELGFTYKPKNTADIIEFIKNPDLISSTVDVKKALLTYYLGQHRNWLFTKFTPTKVDFSTYLNMGLDGLLNDPSVKIYIESLEKGLPLSYVNHKVN